VPVTPAVPVALPPVPVVLEPPVPAALEPPVPVEVLPPPPVVPASPGLLLPPPPVVPALPLVPALPVVPADPLADVPAVPGVSPPGPLCAHAATPKTNTPEYASRDFFTTSSSETDFERSFPRSIRAYANSLDIHVKGLSKQIVYRAFSSFFRDQTGSFWA
jgi:hypothetical protein